MSLHRLPPYPQGDAGVQGDQPRAGGEQSTVFSWSCLHTSPLFLCRGVEVEGPWAEATHCTPFSLQEPDQVYEGITFDDFLKVGAWELGVGTGAALGACRGPC